LPARIGPIVIGAAMDDEDGAFEERPLRIERHQFVEHLDHELAALSGRCRLGMSPA
jgi:hypothetical protein